MNIRPTVVSLFLFLAMAEEAAGKNEPVWFRVLGDCRKAGSATQVRLALTKDEEKRGLTHCSVEEKSFPMGTSLYRNCDQLEGYELFGSSKSYCRWLENPKAKKRPKSGQPR